MQLSRLAYISRITGDFSEPSLLALLTQARKNNYDNNITSALIYGAEVFIQIIEGDKQGILDLFSTIKQDHRHDKVIILFEESAEKRNFPYWSMRLVRIEDTRFDRILEFNHLLEKYKQYEKVNLKSTVIDQIKNFSADHI